MRSVVSALLLAASATVGWFAASGAQGPRAATVQRLDVDGLVERADWVVEGRVVGRRLIERPDGGLDTEFTLDTTRDFLGGDLGDRTFRLPGGIRADGSGLAIPGLPEIAVGEEVLLTLTPAGFDGRRLPVGLSQGKFSLLTDRDGVRRAVRTGDALGLLGGGTFGASAVPYAALAAELEAACNHRRATEGR